MSTLSLNFLVFLAPVIILACKKEDQAIITDSYIGNFWSVYGYYDTVNELNVPLNIVATQNSELIINQTCTLAIIKDSVQGSLVIPDSDYLIDPYLIGTWSKPDGENYHLVGSYAALKNTDHPIIGTFEITPSL